jgi:hypothetical protein
VANKRKEEDELVDLYESYPNLLSSLAANIVASTVVKICAAFIYLFIMFSYFLTDFTVMYRSNGWGLLLEDHPKGLRLF